jgi:hypothetical protein
LKIARLTLSSVSPGPTSCFSSIDRAKEGRGPGLRGVERGALDGVGRGR